MLMLPHKLSACRVQPTMEDKPLLIVEWHKLLFTKGNEETVFLLTAHRDDVAKTRCKVKKLFPLSCKPLLCFINLQMSHTFIVLYK